MIKFLKIDWPVSSIVVQPTKMTSSQDTVTYSVKITHTETHTITKEGLRDTLWKQYIRSQFPDAKAEKFYSKRFNQKFEALWRRLCKHSSKVFHKIEGTHSDIPQSKISEQTGEPIKEGMRGDIDAELFSQL